MTDPRILADLLQAYRDAVATEDDHALAARRRRLLPRLREDAGRLRSAADLRTAVAVLDASQRASFGPLPQGDTELKDDLGRRLAAIPVEAHRVPVLLVDEATGDGVVAELLVELTEAPGQGKTVAMVPVDDAADAAARRAVNAAPGLLRRQGLGAEPADLEVAWQVGGVGGAVAGPSIGLGVALAVVARALGKPVPADTAVTGELDLDGRTVPVSGVERKAAAARASGHTRVLVPRGSGSLDAVEVADLATAAQILWGLRPPRAARAWLRPATAGAFVLVALLLGLLEIPAVLGYGPTAAALPPEAISDRVVLVTWSRDDDPGPALAPADLGDRAVAPLDLAAFPDHKSYRAAHPVVLRRLAEAGAAAVGFDVWFSGGDSAALAELRQAVVEARAQGTEVILPARQSAGRWDGPDPELASAATATASAYLIREGPFGLVRSLELGLRDPDPGAPSWSMAVALASAAAGAEPRWNGPDHVQIGRQNHHAPDGRRLLAFPASPDYRRYSYADVYAGRFDPADFDDSLVLVGGRLGSQDRHRTPSGEWYGVELLAAGVDSLVGRHQRLPVSLGTRAGIVFTVALLALLAFRRVPLFLVLMIGTGLACLSTHQLSVAGLVWPWTDVAVLLAAMALFATGASRTAIRKSGKGQRGRWQLVVS